MASTSSTAVILETFLSIARATAEVACSVQAILMTSQLCTLETIASAISAAVGKKVRFHAAILAMQCLTVTSLPAFLVACCYSTRHAIAAPG